MKIASSSFLLLLLLFLVSGFASFSTYISYDVFESHVSTSRSLLQTKTACSEDFANKNYTIITSQCKGPNYPKEMCCKAFKEFACPYAEIINNENSDCAATMFSYINLYGRYPPGIFANMCKEDKNGLDCADIKAASPSHGTTFTPWTIPSGLVGAFLVFLLQMF